jgi:hypothetical protein
MSTEWLVEEREPGWLGRLIAPSEGGRPVTAAVAVGALAAVAFALSMAFDWSTVTIVEPNPAGLDQADQPQRNEFAVRAGVGTLDSLSLVYALGMVALLGAVGAVVTRPELAVRLRLAATGVTAGLIGVVVATTLRLPTVVSPFALSPNYDVTNAIEIGLFFGYGAVVLPIIAIWLASRRATRPAPPAAPVSSQREPVDEEPAPVAPFPRGLSVSGGPLDLTVTPG